MTHDEEPKLLPKEPIPDFKSIEEEAAFWDTHDFTDYLDEFKPVTIRVSKNFRSQTLSNGITVRLDAPTLVQLREFAQQKGIGPSTLARMWILEKLHEEVKRAAS
ncbi:MAG: CopG family antitoxin [Thermomicrobiales bacterium]